MHVIPKVSIIFTKGLSFGLLLQFAVGPVCLFIFEAGSSGFFFAETAVLAVTLTDAIFILLAILGIAPFLQHQRTGMILKIFGAIVVGLFALNTILESCGAAGFLSFPSLPLPRLNHPFWEGLLLTASNPLTILFWAGVFTAKVSEENYRNVHLSVFALGCITATFLFLTGVAGLGSVISTFLPPLTTTVIKFLVGLFLLYFAVRLLWLKKAQ